MTPRRSTRSVVALVGSLLLALACEQAADLREPKLYAKDQISFRYPSNWSISEDRMTPGRVETRQVIVESPGSALVILQNFRPGTEMGLEEYAQKLHDARMAAAPQVIGPLQPLAGGAGTSRPVRVWVADETREGLEQEYSAAVASVKVPHRVRTFRIEGQSETTFLLVQAPIEDWDAVVPGFDLIVTSVALGSAGSASNPEGRRRRARTRGGNGRRDGVGLDVPGEGSHVSSVPACSALESDRHACSFAAQGCWA